MTVHLADNAADRALGEIWEDRGDDLARWCGMSVVRHQQHKCRAATWRQGYGDQVRRLLLTDLSVFSYPNEHHELKHKRPTRRGYFGWEQYRLDALIHLHAVTRQPVYLTIHDWQAAGARESDAWMPNVMQHWRTIDVCTMQRHITGEGLEPVAMKTWLDGHEATVPGYYWPVDLWMPLDLHWGVPGKGRP